MEIVPKKRSGLQAKLSRKTGIPASTICCIFSGKRRATPEQAEALAPLLADVGVAITVWDMASCKRGTPLAELDRNNVLEGLLA